MRTSLSSLMLAALFALPSFADPCDQLPAAARQYFSTRPGWHVLRLSDLIEDDRNLWTEYHKDLCPGLAVVDFDGSGGKYVALALVHQVHAETRHRIVVIRPVDHSMEEHTIYSDSPYYCVIWRVGPGIAKEWDSDKKVVIRHDSLIVERLESAAQQYYWKNGGFRYVQTSD